MEFDLLYRRFEVQKGGLTLSVPAKRCGVPSLKSSGSVKMAFRCQERAREGLRAPLVGRRMTRHLLGGAQGRKPDSKPMMVKEQHVWSIGFLCQWRRGSSQPSQRHPWEL